MLSKLFKKRKLQIIAPVNGETVTLEQVPDPVFSQKMMGEGIALLPAEGKIHAPIDGTVILIPDTKHAIALKSSDGTEILIHIGLETVNLKGKGFNTLVKIGENVSIGQPLVEVDWAYIEQHATSTITPIIITNSADRVIELNDVHESILGETVLFTVSPK